MATARNITGSQIPRRRLLRAGTVAAAALVDIVIWTIAVLAGDVRLEYALGPNTATVGPASVIASTLIVGLLAWALLAGLEKITPHATAIWTTIAVTILAVSLASPIMTAQSQAAVTTLVSMHVVAAVIVITGFLRSESRRMAGSRSRAADYPGRERASS